MEEEKNNTQEPKKEENKNIKIVLIIIAVLVVFGLIYRINAYYKYKKVENAYEKQIETLEKHGAEMQADFLKQAKELNELNK